MNQIDLSIVVPCFNEEKNIPFILDNFNILIADKPHIELILVDNGSTDNTSNLIDQEILKNNYKFVKKVTVNKNIGYGFGILTGLKEAKGKILSWTHADLQTDPQDVLRAYEVYTEKVKKEAKVFLKGHRKSRRFLEKFFSCGMELLSSLCLGKCLLEINAQPKLFSRDFYNLMKTPPNDFSLDLYVLYLARREGYKIISIPVFFKKRLYCEAKGGGGDFKSRWKLIKRTFKYIFELRGKIAKREIY